MALPDIGFFVWTGPRIPAFAWLAMRAALDRCSLARIELHAEPEALAGDPLVADLVRRPGFYLVDHRLSQLTGLPDHVQHRIAQLEGELGRPASKANLMRLRVLWAQGGIYLDTDCIALQSHRPLLALPGFVGLEHVALPARVVHSKNPLRWLGAGLRIAARDLASRSANPGKTFAAIAPLYDLSCNNAALGFSPQHPMLAELLTTAAGLSNEVALTRFELGPRLLERVTGNQSRPDCTLLPPPAFYPLAPEICAAYIARDPQGLLGDSPDPRTYAAHLYDSVLLRRLGQPLDAQWLLAHRHNTLLGRMVAPYLDELAALQ
jgi:hypothetical protein